MVIIKAFDLSSMKTPQAVDWLRSLKNKYEFEERDELLFEELLNIILYSYYQKKEKW